jgi:hypothetical protein
MNIEQRPLEWTFEKFFPARAYGEIVEVEHHRAKCEENSSPELQLLAVDAQVDKVAEVEAEETDADEKACEQSQAAEQLIDLVRSYLK